MPPFTYDAPLALPATGLGPAGPFPRAGLTHALDRRWLHYAFLSRDGRHALVANAAWLGPAADDGDAAERFTTILLLHERDKEWASSQFNAEISQPSWSAFRLPHAHGAAERFMIGARAGAPAVDLELTRTSRACTSQCAFFADRHHLRWQSETGVRAQGSWNLGAGAVDVDAVGYHERVRGRWGWPELGEWVFGFANDLSGDGQSPPAWAGVFTFIRPVRGAGNAATGRAGVARTGEEDATTASFMLWRNGRLCRHFPRRNTSFAVRGMLAPDALTTAPPLARLLGVRPMSAVPKRLAISARLGDDWALLDFESEAAVRIVIPSETSIDAFSVHEVVGPCLLAGRVGGRRFEIETRGIVEFSGGAGGD